MANATKLPDITLFEWSTPSDPRVVLDSPLLLADTVIYWSQPPLDKNGAIITGGFFLGVGDAGGFIENIWIKPGTVAADGLSATDIIRGVDLSGTDYDTPNSRFIVEHEANSPVFRVVSPVEWQMIVEVLRGGMTAGGNDLIVGDETEGTVTLYRADGVGTKKGFLRWFLTSGKSEFSNDGTNWISFNNVTASNLVAVSGSDSTPSTLFAKMEAGDNVTLEIVNPGADEKVKITAASKWEAVDDQDVFFPPYTTGGTGCETNPALWDSIHDGGFRIYTNSTGWVEITPIDFDAVTDNDDVAALIQTEIRAKGVVLGEVALSEATFVFDTSRFVVTSGDTSESALISVFTYPDSGTDISGRYAVEWLDMYINAYETLPVMNKSASIGKALLAGDDGVLKASLMADNTSQSNDLRFNLNAIDMEVFSPEWVTTNGIYPVSNANPAATHSKHADECAMSVDAGLGKINGYYEFYTTQLLEKGFVFSGTIFASSSSNHLKEVFFGVQGGLSLLAGSASSSTRTGVSLVWSTSGEGWNMYLVTADGSGVTYSALSELLKAEFPLHFELTHIPGVSAKLYWASKSEDSTPNYIGYTNTTNVGDTPITGKVAVGGLNQDASGSGFIVKLYKSRIKINLPG